MNKSELAHGIAQDLGVTLDQATRFIDSFVSHVKTTLRGGDEVALVGFGTFKAATRKAREGINPKTGEKIKIAERRVPKFSPGKALKEALG